MGEGGRALSLYRIFGSRTGEGPEFSRWVEAATMDRAIQVWRDRYPKTQPVRAELVDAMGVLGPEEP